MSCIRGPLTTNTLDYYVQHYVFPAQFVALFVIAGTVLYTMATSRTKHIARTSLFILSIVDILMFLCMLPQSLGSFEMYYGNESFRRFFFASKLPLYALSNLLSAIDTYVIVLITLECYLRSRSSSTAKVFFAGRYYIATIAVMFLCAFLVSAYHHVLYEQKTKLICDGAFMITRVTMNSKYMTHELFVIMQCVSGAFVIAFPTVIVALLNHLLAKHIRQQKSHEMTSECMELFSSNNTLTLQKRKVTVYLPAIAVCFAVTHIFSFLPFLWEMFLKDYFGTVGFAETVSVMNALLISGKIANFGLLYLSCIEMARNGLLDSY